MLAKTMMMIDLFDITRLNKSTASSCQGWSSTLKLSNTDDDTHNNDNADKLKKNYRKKKKNRLYLAYTIHVALEFYC